MTGFKIVRCSIGVIALASVSGAALAQADVNPAQGVDASAAASDASASDIIVTAQRRDESLSKTPVSVAVVGAEALAKAQVVSEQDLRLATPGLAVRATFNSNQLNYALRGQTKDAFSGTTPGVLPYINEVQIGGAGGSTAFYDLQSVQVLKGPQGTLFGRSATGGAVLFTTAKPTDELGGYASASYGNYNALKVEGAVNLPLSGDKLMARVAGFYQKRDGFQRNLYDGTRSGDIDRFGGRGSLTFVIGALKNELVVDYLESNSENTIGILAGLNNTSPIRAGTTQLYGGTDAGTGVPSTTATGQAILGGFFGLLGYPPATAAAIAASRYSAYFAEYHHYPSGLAGFLATQRGRSPFVIDVDANNFYKGKNTIVTNTTSFEISDTATIKNIFGYTKLLSRSAFDVDGSPYGIFSEGPLGSNTSQDFSTRQVSNELQLVGTAAGDTIDYVVGGYYSNDRTRTEQFNFSFDILGDFLGGPGFGIPQTLDYTITNETFAGYAQGTYKLNDSGLAFTLGARYTSEKVSKLLGQGDQNLLLSTLPCATATTFTCTNPKSDTFKKVSWTVGVQDQVTDDLLLYAASRRAYKSGGFNGTLGPRDGNAQTGGDGFAPEKVTDVELGLKFNGRLGSMPTRVSLAGYHNWISNNQRVTFSVVGTNQVSLTANVPTARTYGVELDGQIKPIQWLTLGGTFNYIHARFTNGATFANGLPQNFDQVPDTPEISTGLFADIEFPIGNLTGQLHGDVYHQSKTFVSPVSVNPNGTTISGYTLANFRVGIADEATGWSLTANLKNAFNRIYYAGGIPLGEILDVNTLVPGEPRTFTVEARIKF